MKVSRYGKKTFLPLLLNLCVFFLFTGVSEAATSPFDAAAMNKVRIAEYGNDPASQIFLMQLVRPFLSLNPLEPAWQTFDSGHLEKGTVLNYDMIFTGNEEYVKKLEEQGLLRSCFPLYREELILAAPPAESSAYAGSSATEVMRDLFSKNKLFFSLMGNEWVERSEHRLWEEAGIAKPGDNKYYVESGQDDVEALMQAGDENAYILIGEGSFAQYQDALRGGPLMQKLTGTGIYRTYYVCLVSSDDSKKLRAATADQYAAWLKSDKGHAFIDNFELGGIKPFKAIAK